MLKKSVVAMGLLAACLVGPATADVVCQAESYCEVVYNRTYGPTSQFAGQPYDYLTVRPDGAGETFANINGNAEGDGLLDVEVRVYLRNCAGTPLPGIPNERVVLFSNALCICPGGSDADLATDENGCALFTGSIAGGGCSQSVDVFADGVFICTLQDGGGRTVKINSTDTQLASPCFTDASDLSALAAIFGSPANGTDPVTGKPLACFDYNELDPDIAAPDLAGFAQALQAACQ